MTLKEQQSGGRVRGINRKMIKGNIQSLKCLEEEDGFFRDEYVV